MIDKRRFGVLLHPTSLPGRFGIGDLGPGALRFLDWLEAAGAAAWQVLPVGPTGFGDSPYQCFSCFAGSPLLISPEGLVEQGLLERRAIGGRAVPASFARGPVDYGPVIVWKTALLQDCFAGHAEDGALRRELAAYRKREAAWIEDYALFMAIKEAHGGEPWSTWPAGLRRARPAALDAAREEYASRVDYHVFTQWIFDRQWNALRAAAAERGIGLVGDAPIYAASDSSDVWANQGQFWVDAAGRTTRQAGVPPDYFSATGQLWGNPLYRWKKMEGDGFAWWMARLERILALFDVVRIDHFRGFEAYWEVPGGEKTAVNGRWKPGPGAAFFDAVRSRFGEAPLIAENLGVITEAVEDLRRGAGLPGMKVLQFAWDPAEGKPLRPDPAGVFLPHQIDDANVAYTGSHDNPTTVQWWESEATAAQKKLYHAYTSLPGDEIAWEMIRTTFSTRARLAVIPMQDVLSIGAEGRMNHPGRAEGNWTWRLDKGGLKRATANRLRRLAALYERLPDSTET